MVDYNPNEINLNVMQDTSYLRGRKDELTDIMNLIVNISRPTKQVQDLIDKLTERSDSYLEELF